MPLVQDAIAILGGPDVASLATQPSKFKEIQTTVLLACHTLIPPVRNDFAGLRFTGAGPAEDDLRDTGSPNYVEVADDGSMAIVINAFKTDHHTSADTYDPAEGDFVFGLDTSVRIPLAQDDTMAKFGFQPELLATLLGLYRRAVSTIFGDRNDKEFLFFNFGSSGTVEPLKADGLGKRIGRRLK